MAGKYTSWTTTMFRIYLSNFNGVSSDNLSDENSPTEMQQVSSDNLSDENSPTEIQQVSSDNLSNDKLPTEI